MTGKDVLSENNLLEKAATIGIFEYSPLGKELKAKTEIVKKQYQKLNYTHPFDKIIRKRKVNI